ncbi:MAG: hypothetical protein KGS09_19940 [Nitrospirae bacterium]|nr:hypothetical protein [Nitrospirota bacterium]
MDCEARSLSSQAQLQREWDAMPIAQQLESFERFEQLCQQGIGDTHRFYRLLMPRALRGYVGD